MLKLFPLTPSVLTSPLSWGRSSFSHLFLLTLSYLANKFILWTTGLAQSPSCPNTCQKYFPVLLPSSYYKACTRYFPVLLRTTKLAQSTSQYCFVVQSLHKVLPSTASYYKACTRYFPVLLRTTKLAQGTSQYYFVPQSLHKVLPSTTS